jgi:sporulation protein YlmC with PRC-barrel domain
MKKVWGILMVIAVIAAGCRGAWQPDSMLAVAIARSAGYRIVDTHGTTIGAVDGLIVDSKTGAITYAIVSLPPEPSAGQEVIVIPWDRLQFETETNTLLFKPDTILLREAPRLLDPPDSLAAGWDNEIRRYWWDLPTR